MSCNREVEGDFELEEVLEAIDAEAEGMVGFTEDDGGLIIDGPRVSCNATRLEEGSDRVTVWNINSATETDCEEFVTFLLALRDG